jgi:hypothetical protein
MKLFLKIIIVIVIVTVIVGVGYWVWQRFVGPAIFGTPAPAPEPIIGFPEPIVGEIETGFNRVTSRQIFDYWLKPDGNVYLVTLNGEIYRISPSGEEEQASSQTIQNLHSVNASTDGNLAIVSFGYPLQETFAIFDTRSNSWQAMPEGIITADWDPASSDRIIYLKSNGLAGNLSFFTLSNKRTREIMKLNLNDVDLTWANSNLVYVSEKPSASMPGSVWAIDINNRTIRKIIRNGSGIMVNWNAGGSVGLKSEKSALSLINGANQRLASLRFNTLASKCAWTTENLYCAVPRNLAGRTLTLPDDYLKRKIYSDDELRSFPISLGIDDRLNDFSTPLLLPLLTPLDIEKMEIQGDQLYFINRYDRNLYRLSL